MTDTIDYTNFTPEDLKEAKAVLDMCLDSDDGEEVEERLQRATYHPDDAEDLVEAATRLLLIANNYQ